MQIESVTLRELHMPLVHFFETSFGRTTERRVMLVELQLDGITAWGECVAGEHPYYSEESIGTAWYAIQEELAPALLGRRIESGREVPALLQRVRGHRMAKAALENAVWEAEAQLKKVPLWTLLGGTRSEIACGVSIGIQDSPEQLLDKIAAELAAGYQRIKVKCKPGWDLKIFERIRERWPQILLSCDANSAYMLSDLEHLKHFDQFNLLMIEQPLWNDDFYFHAKLQRELKTPLCLDEAIHHARSARAAIELGSCRIINVKVGRVGGFTEAIAIHDVAKQNKIPVWCGGMLESGIGRAHNVALSTLPNFSLPGDVSASKRYWRDDIIEPAVVVSTKGTIAVSNKPGRGYEVKTDLIDRLTVRKKIVRQAAAVRA
ncbi:MAG TPA: o-succinylbenzoate synthase [Terriglobales bacterium]|nr:o-succinylbenzoate synthase [Terriglobales bacterium]